MRPVVVAAVLIIAILLGLVAQAQGAKSPRAPVDLNHATVPELMTLPGVGKSKAEAIVRYRATKPFARTSDLLHVKGFGRSLFARLRPFLALGPAPAVIPAPASISPKAGAWPGAEGLVGQPGGTVPQTSWGSSRQMDTIVP